MTDNTIETAARRTVACRCEEVLQDEVIAALVSGAQSVDDVKRRTRAGMGVCQGIYCLPAVAAVVAQATVTAIELLAPMTARPPLRPISLDVLADLPAENGLSGESPTGEERD